MLPVRSLTTFIRVSAMVVQVTVEFILYRPSNPYKTYVARLCQKTICLSALIKTITYWYANASIIVIARAYIIESKPNPPQYIESNTYSIVIEDVYEGGYRTGKHTW